MFNKKNVREAVGYLTILAFLLQVVLQFVGVKFNLGPSGHDYLSSVCLNVLFVSCFGFSFILTLHLFTNTYVTYKWNVFGIITYILIAVAFFITSEHSWPHELLAFVYGPVAILVEWFTKPQKIESE